MYSLFQSARKITNYKKYNKCYNKNPNFMDTKINEFKFNAKQMLLYNLINNIQTKKLFTFFI